MTIRTEGDIYRFLRPRRPEHHMLVFSPRPGDWCICAVGMTQEERQALDWERPVGIRFEYFNGPRALIADLGNRIDAVE